MDFARPRTEGEKGFDDETGGQDGETVEERGGWRRASIAGHRCCRASVSSSAEKLLARPRKGMDPENLSWPESKAGDDGRRGQLIRWALSAILTHCPARSPLTRQTSLPRPLSKWCGISHSPSERGRSSHLPAGFPRQQCPSPKSLSEGLAEKALAFSATLLQVELADVCCTE